MKKMMVLVTGLAVSFAACTKSGIKSTPPAKINQTGCVIASHSVSEGPFQGRTVYYYDKNNQMTNYAFFNNTDGIYPSIRDTLLYTTPGVVANVIMEVGVRSDQHLPDVTLRQYFTTGFPPNEENLFTTPGKDYKPGDVPSSPIHLYTYNLDFDKQNRLYYVERADVNGSGRVKMNIFYNDKGNVTSMVIEPITGIRGTTTITVSAYDDKPNPYANIPYWKFAQLWEWIDPYDVESLLTSLSQNNPMDFTLATAYTGSPTYMFSRTMTYTYNDKDLPVTRSDIQNQTGQAGGASTYAETYTYNCK